MASTTTVPVVIPTPKPQEFGRDYPELYEGLRMQIDELTKSNANAPRIRRNLGPEANRLMRSAEDLHSQMSAQGWQPATLINFNPFPVKVNGKLHSEEIPACKPGEKFAVLVLDNWALDTRDNGNGVFTVHAYVPMQLAEDYKREAQLNEWGGIFAYPGAYQPEDPNMPTSLKGRVKAEMDVAYKSCLRWCRKMVRVADSEFNRPNGDRRIIGDLNRAAAAWLLERGHIAEKARPKWMDVTSDEAAMQMECPACKKRVDAGAVQCACAYIFNPVQAYLLGMITELHPALKRLPAWKLAELGLDDVKSIYDRLPEVARDEIDAALGVVPVAAAAVSYAETGELPKLEDEIDEDDDDLGDDEGDDDDDTEGDEGEGETEQATATDQAPARTKKRNRKRNRNKAKAKDAAPKSEAQAKAEESL